MIYIVLIAGIILIFYGIRGNYAREEPSSKVLDNDEQFKNLLSDSLLQKRLDSIDEKLFFIEEAIYEIRIKDKLDAGNSPLDTGLNNNDGYKDINSRILSLSSEGLNVEEIAVRLGITKGEVLLRLGMKK